MSDRYGYIAIETLLNFCENSKDHAVTPNDFMRMARVQVSERKRGKWLDGHRAGYGESLYWYIYCSECLYERDDDNHDKDTPFCPDCGADMRKGSKTDDS